MADRYWVGGSGDWSQTTHWSTISGGASGAARPTSSDDVYFDENSFSAEGQIVTITPPYYYNPAYCNSMNWTGALYNPTLAIGTYGLDIGNYSHDNGRMTLISEMSIIGTSNGASMELYNVPTVDFKGLVLTGMSVVINVYDGYTTDLQSDIHATGFGRGIEFDGPSEGNGTINTNNYNLTSDQGGEIGIWESLTVNFGSSAIDGNIWIGDYGAEDKNTLNFGSSTWRARSWYVYLYEETINNNYNWGTATFNFYKGNEDFHGGGLTYPRPWIFSGEIETGEGHNMDLYDSNTFSSLTINPGVTIEVEEGTTQTFSAFSAVGIASNKITLLSQEPGEQFTFTKSGGEVCCDYLTLTDSLVMGSYWHAGANSTNVSNNTGWLWTSCSYHPYLLEGEPMGTGVYTLGRHSTSYPVVLDLTYPISERDGTDLVLDGVEIGSILIDDDDVYVTWKRTTDGIETFGIDKIDSDNKLSGAYFETRVLSGNREQLGNFSKFIISYGELPTGTDIIVSYSKNYGTDWNTMTTKKDIDRKLLYCEEEFEASSVAYRAVITATGNDAPAIERADIIMR